MPTQQYSDYINQEFSKMERNEQKLNPPKFKENKEFRLEFPKHTSGYQISESREYADQQGLKRFFVGLFAVLVALAIINYLLPGITFEDIFVKGGRP